MTYRVKREGEDFFQAKTFCMLKCFENNAVKLLELCHQTIRKVSSNYRASDSTKTKLC